MHRLPFLAALATSTVVVALAACGGGGNNNGGGTNTFTTGGTTASGTGGATATTSGTGGDVIITTGSGGTSTGTQTATGGSFPYLIYASTDTDLYTLDPQDPQLTLTHVGTFDCIGPSGSPNQQSTAMTDVAVDRDQNIWGLSAFGVRPLTVQGSTVHCGQQIPVRVPDPNATNPSFPYIKFYAATFAPAGVIRAGVEVLVAGDTAGELWAIDTTAPGGVSIKQHGVFGTVPADDGRGHTYPAANVGKLWELSGDIVFLENGGNPIGFATVRDCPNPPDTAGCSKIDTLIEIDVPALAAEGTQSVMKAIRGQIVRRASCTDSVTSNDYGSMYGIAAWNDLVYGFSRTGKLVQISNDKGDACMVQDYASQQINFSGAAVTTQAPVKPPPPVN
jgi:hypothetical protein